MFLPNHVLEAKNSQIEDAQLDFGDEELHRRQEPSQFEGIIHQRDFLS